MKIVKCHELDEQFYQFQEIEEISSVKDIISDVQKNGDDAVKKYTSKFDNVTLDRLSILDDEIKNAEGQLDEDKISNLKLAAENIKRFALRQLEQSYDFELEIQPGVHTGQKIIPLQRVGVYTPGGLFPLPSTVLMCCIPAKIAGVEEIALCSPPTYNGTIHPAILVAATICDVNEIYKIGGVQAIAAMAYGTETIRPVDKIVGPGNKYVAAAKKSVFGAVGIDFIAGPTELLIIADESAAPEFIAADLLGQAEHDTNAVPILVCTSIQIAEQVNQEIEQQLIELRTANIASVSLSNNGLIIIVDSIDEAVEIANRKAPEHLELHVANPGNYIDKIKNYGSLFIGTYAAEALGDYSSGLNHTLPTNRCARYTGGLSVRDFIKIQTTLRVTREGLSSIGPIAKQLGEIEGLPGHAKSVEIRMRS